MRRVGTLMDVGPQGPGADEDANDTQPSGRRDGQRPPQPSIDLGGSQTSQPKDEPDDADGRTYELPLGYRPEYDRGARVVDAVPPSRFTGVGRGPIVIGLSLLLVVALIAAGFYFITSRGKGAPTVALNSPQGVVDAYLLDYTGAKYEAMYSLISAASIQQFSDPNILRGNYKSAHDYIVERTPGILSYANIYSVSASPGAFTQTTSTSGSYSARLVYSSASVGDFIQDITIPVVQEHGKWKISWTPGLIFSQLDDATDPNFTHRVCFQPETGLRGTIYDANGDALAVDETVYQVGVVPGKITNEATLLSTLSSALGMTQAVIKAQYQGAPADQFALIRTITPMLYSQIQSTLDGLAGVQVQTATGRVYPYGAMMAPVTGYVGQVTQDDINNDKTHYYASGDVIGRAGVEQWGETYLRPIKGGVLTIQATNADGTCGNPTYYTVASRTPVNGADIHTSISLKAQQAAMTSLANQSGHSGGTVSVDPTTGAVLSLGTYPIYDPNDLSLGRPDEQDILSQLDHPFLNRAYADPQPIGSAFKPITLAAALQNGVTPTQQFTCTGSYLVPGESAPRQDDVPTGHGTLTAPGGIGPSCDVVFWKVSVLLNQKNPNLLPAMAKSSGFGAVTGMTGLPAGAELPGLVPDPAWLKANKNANWTDTDAANLAIGQGFFLATPAQVAAYIAAVADNGIRMQERLVTSVTTTGGATLVSYPAKQLGTLPISAENLSIIQGALLDPLYASNGTAYGDFHTFPFLVAGKTGTAQSNEQNPNGWFETYAPAAPVSGPAVTPKIAVGTLVEFSSFGEQYALPVSRATMGAYLGVAGY